MDHIETFLEVYPELKWHDDLLRTLKALHEISDKGVCKFDMKAFSAKLQIPRENIRNYFKRLEKLEVIVWKRFVGKKGPIEIQIL